MEQKCALEKQILQNAVSLSSTAPDETAFRIMKTSGYTAVTAREMVHLIKCIPIACRARQTNECHKGLQVTYKTYPHAEIQHRNQIRNPNRLRRATANHVHDSWVRSMPRLVQTILPRNILSLTRPTWKYVKPASLARSGIYSTSDLDRLRSHNMFSVEKPPCKTS
jgi:hypothetical protein